MEMIWTPGYSDMDTVDFQEEEGKNLDAIPLIIFSTVDP